MWIRVRQDTLIDGQWTGVGNGNFAPAIAEHLINIGVAEALETKIDPPTEKKSPSSALQPAPASPESKPKKRRGRPRKSSASTTHGD